MLLNQIEMLKFSLLKRISKSVISGSKSLNFLRLIFLILFIVPAACEKEENSHDTEVTVNLIDQNWVTLSDHSGVAITLSRGRELFQGLTDEQGKSVYYDLPYGIFDVSLDKEGFISDLIQPEITHHKGDSVWLHSFDMVETPHFKLIIDSIIIDPAFGQKLLAFGTISDTRGEPPHQYGMRVFFGDTPDVSKDNYLYYHFGTILKRLINDGYYEMWITNWHGSLIQGDFDTLYVSVYPCAFYREWTTLRKEGLGTPAEVFEWVVPEH